MCDCALHTRGYAWTNRRIGVRFRPHRCRPAAIDRVRKSLGASAPPENFSMKPLQTFAWLAAMAALLVSSQAFAQQRAQYEALVAAHARANNVPEALVHRVIVRESRYRPDVVGRGGTIGLMQIKLATARGLGYTGDAAGPARSRHQSRLWRKIPRRRLARRQQRPHPRHALLCERLLLRRQAPAAGVLPGKGPREAEKRVSVPWTRCSAGARQSIRCSSGPAALTPPASAYISPVPRGAPMRS